MTTDRPGFPCLHHAPPLARFALTLTILTLLAGYAVAGAYLASHYTNRDERPGLTIDDITAAYHGITSRAPLVHALEAGHPTDVGATLPDPERTALLGWLASPSPSTTFDDLDLGDQAPAEIIARNCLSCHSRAQAPSTGGNIALEYWDDVERLSTSRNLAPTPPNIIMQSIHAHAPSMAIILITITCLACLTRWPGVITGGIATLGALGLAADFAAQWFTRDNAALAWVIVGGGFAYGASIALLALLAIADMWLPHRRCC